MDTPNSLMLCLFFLVINVKVCVPLCHRSEHSILFLQYYMVDDYRVMQLHTSHEFAKQPAGLRSGFYNCHGLCDLITNINFF